MSTYVALLRGINLGSQNAIRMADLKAVLLALGHTSVSTYLRSGNVVFDSPLTDTAALASAIQDAIEWELGPRVTVLLRDGAELATVTTNNPFVANDTPARALHVTFLAEEADQRRVEHLDADRFLPDEYHVTGRQVYLSCPQGYGRTKLNNAFWERQLHVAATTRNWNTVRALQQLTGG